jgi:methylated-DNA-[protein]-cysteine S-methyltransferase
LTDYLAGDRTDFDLPVGPRGDAAQHRVWRLLTTIPYGETVTYGELAATLADGTTAQEVGQAVGRNPLSIIVPCHRVVGKNGQLTGYAGGLKRKQFLLELEESSEVKAARLF